MKKKKIRCAIYTRKSTSEGLEQEFNTLDAQREACEKYIESQRGEGWRVLPQRYDDGGFTGANMDRPALQQLFDDVHAGTVDCVVVYKVDRLSRSLLDFARIIELFDRSDVAFVSITQQFNTNTSMGRLTLNVLLSFAQFEREIISERTRDKMGAARRKGKWVGGPPVLGYDLNPTTKRLVINEKEAKLVKQIYDLYLKNQSVLAVVKQLNEKGCRTKRRVSKNGCVRGGGIFLTSHVQRILGNVTYVGKVYYSGEVYDGEHEAIIPEEVLEAVSRIREKNRRDRTGIHRNRSGALLKGLLRCKACDVAMAPSYSRKGNRQYRYYVCQNAKKAGYDSCPNPSINASAVEGAVVDGLRKMLLDPAAEALHTSLSLFNGTWDSLYTLEQMRILHLILEHVTYDSCSESIGLTFSKTGLDQLNRELAAARQEVKT